MFIEYLMNATGHSKCYFLHILTHLFNMKRLPTIIIFIPSIQKTEKQRK